ncbi:MAG: flavodoxin family protein [Amnibacterium sp.]
MRVLVVHESMWGNTAKVAEAIASALWGTAEVHVVAARDAPADPGPDVDLLIVGAPTHGLSLPSEASRRQAANGGAPADVVAPGVREWLGALPAGRSWRIATFSTRLRRGGFLAGSAARAAARIARRRGLKVIATADFLVDGTTGPLGPDELTRAAAWATGLVPIRA